MKLPQISQKHRWNYLALSFFVPFGLFTLLLFIASAKPFGEQTMLYSDMYHQYFPFFNAFRSALRSGEPLLWTWSVGMGMDYLGMISYYLASPLNLLSVLVPDGWVLDYFHLLLPLKLGFAGLFFGYMLKKLFGKEDLSIVMFGAMYALCAWALGYQWNIMWLDSFALLPLVALGTVQLCREKKYLLYTLSLFVSVAANYYVGFFVCIFVFLLFWCYEICRFQSIGRLIGDFLRIGAFTILALGMTAFITLPAFAALQNTYSSVNQFPEGFQVNIVTGEAVEAAKAAWNAYKAAGEAGEPTWSLLLDAMKASVAPLWDGMRQVAGQIGGGQTPTYIDGLPNLYCGVLPVALGFLFLLAREVKVRDKLCCVGLLLLFMLSFIVRQLDYIWHGFHFPNQIPYRFSFLFSFVVLYMAYRAWLLRKRFKLWQIMAATVLSVGLFLLNEQTRSDVAYLAYNLAFLGLYFAFMLYSNREFLPDKEETEVEEEPEADALDLLEEEAAAEPPRRRWTDLIPDLATRQSQAALLMALTITLELVLSLVSFAAGFGIYDYDYPKKDTTVQQMLQIMAEQENEDDLFYRTEVTTTQTLNDGALNGFYGISTFSSSANVNVTKFTKSLGAAGYESWNRYCYEMPNPVANLFMNLKYVIERDNTPGASKYFQVLHSYDGVTLMKNAAYLPLGFLAEIGLEQVNTAGGDTFAFQNRLFSAATGLDEKVWKTVSSKDVIVVTENVTTKLENSSGYTSFSTGADNCKLMYHYNITQEGFFCLDLNLYKQKNYTVWHNGVRLFRDGYTLPQAMGVCDVKPGDNIQVVVECTPNMEDTSISIKAAILDDAVFQEGYEILSASTLKLTEFTSTYMKGTIDCNRYGLMYTSVPQDGNWVVYVDGEKLEETTVVGGAMLAFELYEGEHVIEIKYQNTAFLLGLGVSLACALILLQFVLMERRRK